MTRVVVCILVGWFLVAGVGVQLLQGVPGAVGSMASSLTSMLPTAALAAAPPAAATEDTTTGPSVAHDRELACWAFEAGWPAGDIPTLVSIAYPESGGNPSAVQQGQPWATTGWGWLQITPGNSALLDPVANAKAALQKFEDAGDSFSPWTTYGDGLNLQYLPGVESALAGFDYGTC
ncbi:MAG TPA: hypothetical protein VGG07_14275 [Solirubrobacteraceae bacterium]|jgi:hypothetical protein